MANPVCAMHTTSYDAAGNVTNDFNNAYLYDGEGRLCAVQSLWTGAMTGYLYDADGARVAKGTLTGSGAATWNTACSGISGQGGWIFATTTDYVLGPSGEQVTEMAVSGSTSSWKHTNAWAGGKILATYDSATTNTVFYLSDWLGTKRMEIGANGCASTYTSLPFGDGLTPVIPGCADVTEHHYTGKERDAESGNDYFGARYYASTMGRFMSPDNPFADQHTNDPQSWNMYSYVRNSPLMFTDPTGRSTHTNSGGDVTSVSDDGDLGVYRDYQKRHRKDGKTWYTNESQRMGETKYWDEFLTPDDSAIGAGAHIIFGASFDSDVAYRNSIANTQGLDITANESKNGGYFDIKVDGSIAPFGPYTGKLLNGEYASARSAGNFLAGEDAATGTMYGFHISATTNMKLAGALQQGQFTKANAISIITTGKAFGPAPWYGEEGYSGRRIQEGFEYGSNQKK